MWKTGVIADILRIVVMIKRGDVYKGMNIVFGK